MSRPTGSAEPTVGIFHPSPSVTLYLVNDGRRNTLRVTIPDDSSGEGDRVLLRFFDPAEELVHWQYVEPGVKASGQTEGDEEIEGMNAAPRAFAPTGHLLMDLDLPMREAGVYQLRVSAGNRQAAMHVSSDRPIPYGVSFQNGDFSQWNPDLAQAHVFIPPRAKRLHLRGAVGALHDHTGTDRVTAGDQKPSVSFEPTDCEQVWTYEFSENPDWRFRAHGLPFILCDSAEAARRIRASIVELPDGSIVAHQFQRRIAELLPSLLAPEHVGSSADLQRDLRSVREALLADPIQNQRLVSGFDGLLLSINPLLESQDLDASSHWAGSLGHDPAIARWDDYETPNGLWAGTDSRKYSAGAEKLAIAALLDHPANPWYGRQELLYRATAAALKDLMLVREDEIFYGSPAPGDPYPGFMAFQLGQRTLPVYAEAAPHMPPEIRQLWTDATRHLVDRHYPDGLVSARNQSSHYLVVFQAFANGSGLPRYHDLAQAYNRRFIDGAAAPGYYVESQGPDSSYIGMTHWHMATAYHLHPDPGLLEAIRRSYTFFNHTVAPEPDGKMLGGFNFNHRVGDPFANEQWGGARGLLDGLLPEVALWTQISPSDAESARSTIQSVLDRDDPSTAISESYRPASYNMSYGRFLHHAAPRTDGNWPALEPHSFTRMIGDELVAIKRPAYYTACYVGKPAPHPFYISGRTAKRGIDPGESNGGDIQSRKITPFVGGGLSLLWSPDYGGSVIGTPWAPTTHHGLIATATDGLRYWEDYFRTEHELDAAGNRLTVTGGIEFVALDYQRHYQFHDDRIEVVVELTATGGVDLTELVENIPFPAGPAKARGVQVDHQDNRVRIVDSTGAGMEIDVDSPATIRVEANGLKHRDLQIGRVMIDLPRHWQSGQTARLRYTLRPIPAPDAH